MSEIWVNDACYATECTFEMWLPCFSLGAVPSIDLVSWLDLFTLFEKHASPFPEAVASRITAINMILRMEVWISEILCYHGGVSKQASVQLLKSGSDIALHPSGVKDQNPVMCYHGRCYVVRLWYRRHCEQILNVQICKKINTVLSFVDDHNHSWWKQMRIIDKEVLSLYELTHGNFCGFLWFPTWNMLYAAIYDDHLFTYGVKEVDACIRSHRLTYCFK